MAFEEKQLAQARGTTEAASIYSPATGVRAIIKTVTLCNTSGADTTFGIFMDNDGSVTTESTAKFFLSPILARETIDLSVFWPMALSTGNFGFKCAAGNAVTITLDGVEITN